MDLTCFSVQIHMNNFMNIQYDGKLNRHLGNNNLIRITI